MMNHHVSTNARSAILKEIASRLQKQVFDAQFTWYARQLALILVLRAYRCNLGKARPRY